ncbi:OmpA family protein [Marinobacterium sp. YM272]|uniref:OmpA family protein n=1 Tax=Marinobacterium sp. YM272 TaxID=3421654 RepID=UPI003D7FB79D
MSRSAKLLGSTILLSTLTGCTVYSGAVNTFGPDTPTSDLAANDGGEILLSSEPPPFCPALPGDAADALPPAPIYSLIYFNFDSDVMTDASQQEAQRLYQAVLERAAPEVIVTGHTDTSGSKPLNQALGQRRADAVREDLIEIGVDADTITTRSLGETQPLIDTGDGVREERNRRVEINLR